MWSGLEARRRLGAHLAEAITAVHRPIAPGPEGHHGVVAAFGAIDRVHLSGSFLAHPPRPLLGAAHRPATSAAFGFVTETPGLEEFLFSRGKGEFSATLYASKGFV